MDDDSFFKSLPSTAAKAEPKYTIPSSDSLDAASSRAAARLTQAGVISSTQAVGDDDDEFSFDGESVPPPPLAPALPAPLLARKEDGVLAPPPSSPPVPMEEAAVHVKPSLVSDEAAVDALSAVRQALAASAAAEQAKERLELEAHVKATSLLEVAKQEGLGSLGEEDEEEDEEEEEEEEEEEGEKVADAKPKGVTTPNSTSPQPPKAGSEAEALEAAFVSATTLVLLQEGGGEGRAGGGAGATPSSPPTPLISMAVGEGALLDKGALAQYMPGIVPEVVDSSVGCWGRLFAAKFPPSLAPHRDALFALARRPYDGSAPLQTALMAHLYATITGVPSSSPGAAWTVIGFQREGDFSTDLRGVGMLGPLQALSLFEYHPRVAKAMWSLATHTLHPFPFMIQCLSHTAKTLHALRLGKLNGVVGRRVGGGERELWRLVHDWYAGLTADFCAEWRRDKNASINRIGHIFQKCVDTAYAAPEAVLQRLSALEEEGEGRKT